jgi:SAM-dependent methyltransferase
LNVRDLKAYEKAYLDSYEFEKVQASYRRRRVLEILNAQRPRSVLEVGCGLEPLFEHYPGWDRFCVVEPAPGFAANAAERARDRPTVRVVATTFEEFAAQRPTEHYDAIVISSVLHEVTDPDALMAAAYKIADESTLVHVNVPNERSIHKLLALEMGLLASLSERSELAHTLQISRTYDLPRLCSYLEGRGFEVLETGSYFVKPFTHRQMAAMIEHKIIDERVLDGFYSLVRHLPEMGSEIYANLRKRPNAPGRPPS